MSEYGNIPVAGTAGPATAELPHVWSWQQHHYCCWCYGVADGYAQQTARKASRTQLHAGCCAMPLLAQPALTAGAHSLAVACEQAQHCMQSNAAALPKVPKRTTHLHDRNKWQRVCSHGHAAVSAQLHDSCSAADVVMSMDNTSSHCSTVLYCVQCWCQIWLSCWGVRKGAVIASPICTSPQTSAQLSCAHHSKNSR